jgi:hypothetical protein
MKTKAGILVCMCAVIFLCPPARGQITITASDITTIFAVGHTLADKIDTITTSLNIGSLGSTSWDFSALRSDSSQTLTSIAVAGTKFAAQFPGATHVFQTNITYYLGAAPIPAVGYLYFQLSTNLLNLGQGADAPAANGFLTAINKPADIFYGLPSTFGTTWTSVYLDTTDIFILNGGFLFSATGVRHNAVYVVDAFGPMKLPDLSIHDALRIKKTDSTASGKSLSFLFLAKDGASVQASAVNPSGPVVGTITIQHTAAWNGQVVALPIQLASFNASPVAGGDGVLLKWSTISEVNNYGFEIQRSAAAADGFSSLPGAFIPGHGTTTLPRDYSYSDAGIPAGTWYYRLKQMDLDGTVHYSDPVKTLVGENGTPRETPASFSLGQNYPNPFNPVTTISYSVPSRTNVELAVYDLLGQRVALLVDGEQEAGVHQVRFDGSSLASGVYIYRLRAGSSTETKKLSLLR